MPVEISSNKVLIKENVSYDIHILPESPKELGREVEIRDKANINGNIYGKFIDIGSNCKIEGNICGKKHVMIGGSSEITGNLLCENKIKVYKDVKINANSPVNVIAEEIEISDNCEISGNVFSHQDIKIGDNCSVSGLVVSTRGDVEIGNDFECEDIICKGNLELANNAQINDNLIWAGEFLYYNKVQLAQTNPKKINYRKADGVELNMNTNRSNFDCKIGELPKTNVDNIESDEVNQFFKNYDFGNIYEIKEPTYYDSLDLYDYLLKNNLLDEFHKRFKDEFYEEIENIKLEDLSYDYSKDNIDYSEDKTTTTESEPIKQEHEKTEEDEIKSVPQKEPKETIEDETEEKRKEEEFIYCDECGAENNPNNDFCPFCGNEFN